MNKLLKIENGIATMDAETVIQLVDFEKKIKELKAAEDAMKAVLLSTMEKMGVIKVETPELTLTYVAPTERETFDSKKFRKEYPEMYDDYVKFSPVKASLRIKVIE